LKDYFVKIQSRPDITDNTLTEELKKMSDDALKSCFNDPKSLRDLSDDLFKKFDEDGNQDFSIEEFMDLCAYVDPRMDKTAVIDK